jgi:hypothetical protein
MSLEVSTARIKQSASQEKREDIPGSGSITTVGQEA